MPTKRTFQSSLCRLLGAVLLTAAATIALPPRAGAQWVPDGEPLGPPRSGQIDAHIVPDGAGGAIMVWEDLRSCRGDTDIYAQRFDSAGNPLWGTDGVAVCTAIAAQGIPQIVSDLAGGAIVFWNDFRTGDLDIYGQRLGPTGATLWTPDGIPICTATGEQGFLNFYTRTAVSDGAGGALVVWLDRRVPGQYDLYIQHVKDSGVCTFPVDGLPVCTAPYDQDNPAICSDNAGGAIVAWGDDRSGVSRDIYAQRVSAAGVAVWAADGVPVCSAVNGQDFVTMTEDGAGGAIISWTDARNIADQDDYVQRIDNTGAPVWMLDGIDISPAPGSQYSPEIVSDGAGGAVVAWSDAGDVRAQRVNAAGAFLWPYASGLPVCVKPGYQWVQRLARDGTGGALITYEDTASDGYYDIYAQRVTGAGALAWGSSAALSTAPYWQRDDDVIPDGTGGAIVVWQDMRSGPGLSDVGFDIYARRVTGGGVPLWNPDGNVVSAPGSPQFAPAVAPDGFGGAVFAWEDHRAACDGDIYVQRMDASGNRHTGLGGRLICGAPGSQQTPKICSDGSGGGIVVWSDYRNGNADIYVQRVDNTGISQWAGGSPPGHGIPVCDDPSPQVNPAIVACEAGGAIIVWDDRRGGADMIYAQKLKSDGSIAAGWPVNGLQVTTATNADQQFSPQVISDGANGCIVVWQDRRPGNFDIYAQRIDQLGVRQWLISGQPLCAASGDQVQPRLVTDGSGGAIVTWEDKRAGNTDVYAQRVTAAGTPVWAVDGVIVDSGTATQSQPVLATDGSGGAIFAWRDDGGGTVHVDAQRLNSVGTRLWLAAGVPVCSGPGPQQDPVITADGAGGVVIAWRDGGSGGDDIYAQRLDGTGTTHCGSCGIAVCAASANQYQEVIAPDGAGGAILAWTDPRSVHAGDQEVYAMRLAPECGMYATGVETEPAPAPIQRLIQNRPNPFNPMTVISYELAAAGHVRIDLFDTSGRRVRTLVDGAQGIGLHEVRWDGALDSGHPAPSGAYFYKVTFPNGVAASRKMVLLR
jgi:hypothetical protein